MIQHQRRGVAKRSVTSSCLSVVSHDVTQRQVYIGKSLQPLVFIFYSLFLISFSSLRMRDDSCSGVGVLKDRQEPPSAPEGGVGSRCLKSSSMLLCSLRFRPCNQQAASRITRGRLDTSNLDDHQQSTEESTHLHVQDLLESLRITVRQEPDEGINKHHRRVVWGHHHLQERRVKHRFHPSLPPPTSPPTAFKRGL